MVVARVIYPHHLIVEAVALPTLDLIDVAASVFVCCEGHACWGICCSACSFASWTVLRLARTNVVNLYAMLRKMDCSYSERVRHCCFREQRGLLRSSKRLKER